ncbi:hypothetical protein SK642_0987 [Streptococcus mitis]|uniref:Uncharacterized protein n=1 Tax=Streptococcus mitis TaxID=28037 RepID=A0A081QCS8_STRMT|nr:hypothetical protein SK642_0987 [Streptococcus mitis]
MFKLLTVGLSLDKYLLNQFEQAVILPPYVVLANFYIIE